MINTPITNDPWIIRQFEGFGGASSPTYVEGTGGYSAVDDTQAAISGPSNANPNAQVMLNINPLASGFSVMVGPGADGNGAYGNGSGGGPFTPGDNLPTIQGDPFMADSRLQVNGGQEPSAGPGFNPLNWGTSNAQGTEIGPAILPQLSPMPSATLATMPTMVGTAVVTTPSSAPIAITPQSLNDRLPSIVNPSPIVMSQPCAGTGIDGWAAQNPGLAMLALLGLGWMLWGSLNDGKR